MGTGETPGTGAASVSAHVCASCGRSCGACAEAAERGHPLPHTVRAPWCTWCAGIYIDNAPDPETGRVHCAGCDGAFPGLADFIAKGLERYPRHCGTCRTDARRDVDTPPPDRGGAADPRAPVKPPPAAERAPTKTLSAAEEREANWRRGGFVPRTGPDTTESESGSGAIAWTGTRRQRM